MKALSTFFLLTFSFSFVNAQDLMRNGGFENTNHFEFWEANVTVTGASVQPVSTQFHTGAWSVEIQTGTNPIGGWTELMQTLLTPSNNIDYKLTIWLKGSVSASNFLGVYGLSVSGEVALGIDSLNISTFFSPDSGRIKITQEVFQNWTRVNYYFNSGQDFTSYLLKFEEATLGSSLTVYLDDFVLVPVPGQGVIQVTSPNGGEDWTAGNQRDITWTSSNVTNVKINYSIDNGANWLNVVSSVPASNGTYNWSIPNTPSDECLVRISSISNPSIFDVSDNIFTISSAVTVITPNGGEDWLVGDQHNITWTSLDVTNIKIDYSADSGAVWSNVVASVPAVSGSYSWTIPNTPSTQCLVRISDASNSTIDDVSNNTFTISNLVKVTAPNGGENWLANTQHNITWTSQNIANIGIEYSTNNGNNWISIISSIPASGGSYNWAVPNTPSTQCLVRISDVSNASIKDVSDNVFTIAPLITVTTPNGGESWVGNSQHFITWTSQNITNVSIEYSTDDGNNWTSVIASTPASGNSYNWAVPNTPSTECLVRISDASNASITDVSNATFTITAAPIPIVTVTAPNGGETWVAGTNHNITWTRQNVPQVKIEYSTDNGGAWILVVASVPSITGNYNWSVPNTPSVQCLVRISDANNASVNDVSDNTFAIEGGVSVEDLNSGIPDEYNLYQSYPNPFNPSTVIEFSLPEEVANVKLSVYNALGEIVAELVNKSLAAGSYRYQWNAENLAAGMYLYELRTDNFVSVKKMLLVK